MCVFCKVCDYIWWRQCYTWGGVESQDRPWSPCGYEECHWLCSNTQSASNDNAKTLSLNLAGDRSLVQFGRYLCLVIVCWTLKNSAQDRVLTLCYWSYSAGLESISDFFSWPMARLIVMCRADRGALASHRYWSRIPSERELPLDKYFVS